jgi:hypothetical protein
MKTLCPFGNRERAFTRIELCACAFALAVLTAVTLPALATSRSRSDVAQCLNNLRLVGRALQMWGASYREQPPWQTLTSQGGTLPEPNSVKPGNAWFEFTAISNELATPRILACPADVGVKEAMEFSINPIGGYMHTSYRALATSYNLNLHALSESPRVLLFSDRNIKFDGPFFNCSTRVANGETIIFSPSSNVAWTNNIHGLTGNIVRMDGSVSETSSTDLRAASAGSPIDNGQSHMLRAR